MARWAGIVGCAAVTIAVVAALSFQAKAADAPVCDPNGKPANLSFTLKDMNGKDVVLSAYKGQVILLDFWATWCGPCKIEIPGFVEMFTKSGPRGFVILGVSVDDPVSALKPFVDQFKMTYPVLIGLDRDDVKDAFGPPVGFPTSFVIGRDGKVCREHPGFTPKDQFEREVEALL